MFPPDIFYNIVIERYQTIKHPTIFWQPPYHGCKELFFFDATVNGPAQGAPWILPRIPHRMLMSNTFFYDQEPFTDHAVVGLKGVFFDNANPDLHYILDQASTAQIIALWYASTSFPIFCTSDRVGRDIEDLRKHGFVLCYYFYHAFIAREWYRVYQHAAAFDRIAARGHRFVMYCRATDGSRAYRRTVLDQLAPIRSQIHYDWESKHMVDAEASATISRDDAQAADIHLVLETLFDTDKLYLTEKVFKPMVMNQAFIVWGPPGTLRTLREYGFRTFHHVWSEDYDEVADPDQRMAMLIDLVRSLAVMDSKTYRAVLDKCAPVIEHNRRWFYSEQFMSNCWHELTSNYEQALITQHEMSQRLPGGQLLKLADDCPALFNFFPARHYAIRQYLQTLGRDDLKRVLQRYPQFSAL